MASATSKIARHHHSAAHAAAHSTTKSASKEIIIVIESHSSESCKWIVLFPSAGFSATAAHTSEWVSAETSTTKSTSEEVVIIIKESGEWIFATEELSKYLIGALHVEMMVLEAATAAESSTSSARGSASFDELSAVVVVILPLFRVRQYLVSVRDFLEDFLCLLLVIRVFVWMVLEG